MRNSLEKSRIATRNTAIYTQFRVLEKKRLRMDAIIEQLSEQYYLSERGIRQIIRDKSNESGPSRPAKQAA